MKTIKIKKKILLWITVFLGLGGVISGLLAIMWEWEESAEWFHVFFPLFVCWFVISCILVDADAKGKITFT